jgi:glutathione-regulated potassium-efflux system ancillary protein KefG
MTDVSAVLILLAHPALEHSRVNRPLIEAVENLPQVRIHDLYEAYPDFDIDVPREQRLLETHERIVFQHPLFWYSTPALLKEWLDLVLEHGWAYGSTGTALRGKVALSALTTGGGATAYRTEGLNGHSLRQFLRPWEQTMRLCGVRWVGPYATQGTHAVTAAEIERSAANYRALIEALRDDQLDLELAESLPLLDQRCWGAIGGD